LFRSGFVGYAERGPVLEPVKVHNERQFEAAFGAPLPFAFLAPAVRGFFDNGGAACYVARLADPETVRTAALTLPNAAPDEPALRCWASFGAVPDPAPGAARAEEGRPARAESPGAWGNRLAVSGLPAGLGTTATHGPQPPDGRESVVEGLSGFQVGSA